MFDNAIFATAADDLCRFGRILYGRGWSPATSSNYSIRIDANHCALTSSGKHKGELTPADILVVNMAGEAQTDGKPSAETLLHTQLYQRDASIGAVLHTHSPVGVVLSQIWPDDVLTLQGWELQKAFAGETTHEDAVHFPIFANDQNITRLAANVEQHMQNAGQGHAYLIRGHGVYCWGKDLDACMRNLEAVDFLLHCELERIRLSR